jgi:hypothetical protein
MKRAFSVAAVVAAVAVLAASPRADAGATLATGGVRGGEITGFAWDPTHAATVFAGVRGAGLFKSSNGGGAWTQILLPTIATHFVNAVVASKAAADLVFVCEVAPSQSAIWRSGDDAASFAGVFASTSGGCSALADGASSGTLYAGIQDPGNAAHLYRSADAGKTWTATALSLPGVLVSAIVQLPAGRLVIGLRDGAGGLRGKNNSGAIYYSDDDGAHWTMATGAGSAAVAGLAFNGTNELVALTTNGTTAAVFSSADGITFTAGTPYTAGAGGGQVRYHAGSDTFFLMATNDKLLQSSNAAGGYSFAASTDRAAGVSAPVPLSLQHHAAFAVDPADATHLLLGDAAGGEGIFASADGGGVWVVSNDGLFAQQVDLAIKSPAGYRYAANRSGFVYFGGAALGAPWTRVYRAKDLARDSVVALAYDTADNKRVVIAQSDLVNQAALLALPDATATGDDAPPFTHPAWQTLSYPDAGKAPILGLLVDGMTLYAGIARPQNGATGQYLYRSTNGGTSWALTSLAVVGGVRALAFDPSKHATLYAGAGDYKGSVRSVVHAGGLWKSLDGGDTWTRISTANPTLDAEAPRTIVVDPANGLRVWVFCDKPGSTSNTDGDIFESHDGGASWATITPSGGIFAFTYSPAEDLLAYATSGANVNVYIRAPIYGTWQPGFGVYGDAATLYAGSIGVGTATGLFEASGVTLPAVTDGDMGADDLGSDDMMPGDVVDAGGAMPSHGCGCSFVPTTGAAASGLFVAMVFARLLFRRRGARARRRA